MSTIVWRKQVPIFELICQNCNATEETICSYEEYKNCQYECPYCFDIGNIIYMVKVISSGGFKLKGDGFYSPTTGEE